LTYFPKQVRCSHGKFIDSLHIYVRGGAGGMGFPKYGGIGGKGGNIIVVSKEGEKVLKSSCFFC
jgi:GTPase involved in cell partitioning and DNA repair